MIQAGGRNRSIHWLETAQLTKTGFRHTNPDLYVDFSGKIGGGKGLERFGKKTMTFVCGNTLTIVHTTIKGVAPLNKTVTYGTVKSSLTGSEKCWITQNLGSTNQATSETDASEAAAGWYWKFNKKKGYKNDGSNSTYFSIFGLYNSFNSSSRTMTPLSIILLTIG